MKQANRHRQKGMGAGEAGREEGVNGRKRKNGSQLVGEKELSAGESVEGEAWGTSGRGQVSPVL